ncbi:ribosome biogenesis protein NOP53 [Magnolia sinica]|uniref:ribosome biogenesis protein NOP53 n=1 Tax=Magnolia sinica TaxID=86752 RepID=UPI0026591B1A|nr:ribosome biogenesis protein NOP53 [Magnolia sinica]
MGKAKSSRKGKKAWRANISTDDIDDFFEKSTKDALTGGSLSAVPSDSLFFLDKSRDLSVKRKIEKNRNKVLHCDSLLQRNVFVQPVPSSRLKKLKKKQKEQKAKSETKVVLKGEENSTIGILDIWDDKGEENAKAKKKVKASLIPAVEVEPPGCSFNPSFEAHQDSLALAVAEEMQKVYRNELGPQPVPVTVPGEIVNEEDMYFLDADDNLDDEDLGDNGDIVIGERHSKARRVTRVEFNRRARRKDMLKAEAEAKKIENISKEIDCLPDIVKEIAKEDEEKQRRHVRRIISRQERLKSGPPRLGKHKFEPAPVQVLLSEEISGSLRKLKGCCTLARDRFKSLEKRGLLAPTAKHHRK